MSGTCVSCGCPVPPEKECECRQSGPEAMTTPLTSEQCPLCTANRPRLCDGHYQASADNLLNRVTAALHDRHTPDGVKATYEQLLDLNAALRRTIEQQAQTIARLEHELTNGTIYMRTQYDSIVRMKDDLQEQLAAMTTERDAAQKSEMHWFQVATDDGAALAECREQLATTQARVRDLERELEEGA